MEFLSIVSIIMGFFAIAISIISMVFSSKWNTEAKNILEATKEALKKVEKETSNVAKNVEERFGDLIKRAMPSEEEKAQTRATEGLLNVVLEDPSKIKSLMELAEMVEKQNKRK